MTVEPTSGWLDFPSHLAPSGPARTRTSLCSDIAPCSRLALRCSAPCDGAEAHFDTAIHGLLCGFRASAWFSGQQLTELVLLIGIHCAFGLFADQRVQALLHGLFGEFAQGIHEYLAQGLRFRSEE